MGLLRWICVFSILSLVSVSVVAQSVLPDNEEECRQLVGEAKNAFMSLLAESQRDGSTVTKADLKAASREYVSVSQQCFELMYGDSPYAGMPIDENPELPPISDGEGSAPMDATMDGARPQFITYGTKWGAGSPFHTDPLNGFDVRGPGLPGGEVTYSFMATDVSMTGDPAASSNNVEIWEFQVCMDNSSGLLRSELRAAFAAWELVADISFKEVADSGHAFGAAGATGAIRIGFHAFSSGSALAHAFYPPYSGAETTDSVSGDIHFNAGILWECDPGQDQTGGIDMGIVAIHEIGHAIGLRHEGGDGALSDSNPEYAVMNALYDPSIGMPLADDIEGAESIYGSPQLDRTFWGNVGVGVTAPLARLHLVKGPGNDSIFKAVVDSSTYVSINNWGTLSTIVPTNVPNWLGLGILGATDSYGRFGFGLDSGNPYLGFGPGNTNRDIWLKRINGDLTFSFGTSQVEGLRITSNGSVGIGTASPTESLYVVGNIYATGSITPGSSRELKEDIAELGLDNAVETLDQLKPVTFKYRADPQEDLQLGFIAEDVPDLVAVPDRKGVSPMDVVAVLTRVVQEQQERLKTQDAKIAAQDAEIAAHDAEIAEIRRLLSGRNSSTSIQSQDE